METESDIYDDEFLEDDDGHFSDIDITGITDPEKFDRAMKRIEDYLEKKRLRNTLDDFLY